MTARPILFSAPMIRALLEGRKTQTRRIVKPQPYVDAMGNFCWNGSNFGQDFKGPHVQAIASLVPDSKTKRVLCPYGVPGDLLWVREAALPDFPKEFSYYDWSWREVPEEYRSPKHVIYRASWDDPNSITWRPSIHMPRWASRLTLRITDVRVQRLQEISEADALSEGVAPFVGQLSGCYRVPGSQHAVSGTTAVECFSRLWESINGADSWQANPWVWCVSFDVIRANVDRVLADTTDTEG